MLLRWNLVAAYQLDQPTSSTMLILAPTNHAIDQMPGGSYWLDYMNSSLAQQEITQIITYGMAYGFRAANTFQDGDILTSIQGQPIRVYVPYASTAARLYFNFASVEQNDLVGINGSSSWNQARNHFLLSCAFIPNFAFCHLFSSSCVLL